MAAKSNGRRAATARRARRPNAWLVGALIGLVAGSTLAWTYPAPSTDVMSIEAADWYDSMRELVIPTEISGSGAPTGDPKIYADPAVALPPDAETDDDATVENVAELVDVTAPRPDPAQLSAALDEAVGELEYINRVVVADVATGEVLYDRGGADAVVPASTLKLFTAVSALEHLDFDHRFVTSADYDPTDGVTLIGGGDGLLAVGEGTGETMGYAGLADLAADTWEEISGQVAQSGTTVDVWADVSRYAQPSVHPSWNEGLMTSGWVSPVYPMNTYGGFYSNPLYDNTAVEDGAAYAASAFAQRLNELADNDGVDVEFEYAGQRQQSDTETPVAQVRSAPFGQQLEYAMKQSNNMLFEIFGREAAIVAGNTPDFEGSTATTLTTVDDLGVSTEHLQLTDNSGLSPNSTATLDSIIQLYDVVVTQEHLRPLLQTLTVAGFDGTMRNRLDEAPYAGLVRSKTGTLDVATSNAGMTVTNDGRALWFAMNTSGAGEDYAGARAEQDDLTEVITECGCNSE